MPAEPAFAALAQADAALLESLRAGDVERALEGAAARQAILSRIDAASVLPAEAMALAAAREASDALVRAARAELERAGAELAGVRATRRLRERMASSGRGEPRFVSRRA